MDEAAVGWGPAEEKFANVTGRRSGEGAAEEKFANIAGRRSGEGAAEEKFANIAERRLGEVRTYRTNMKRGLTPVIRNDCRAPSSCSSAIARSEVS